MNKKRGRPKTNGVRPGWVLQREMVALTAYDKARKADEKHETALDMMVDAVRCWRAEKPMSRTEAKRILVKWLGKEKTNTIVGMEERLLEGEEARAYIDRIHDLAVASAELKGLPAPPRPDGAKVRVFPFRIGPVPRYRRSNRKQS